MLLRTVNRLGVSERVVDSPVNYKGRRVGKIVSVTEEHITYVVEDSCAMSLLRETPNSVGMLTKPYEFEGDIRNVKI